MPLDVPARPDERPEWHALLGTFQGRFRRPDGREALDRETAGRRPERPNQHGETLAQAVPGPRAPRRPACLPTRPWDEAERHRPRGHTLSAAASSGDGVVVLEAPGFP